MNGDVVLCSEREARPCGRTLPASSYLSGSFGRLAALGERSKAAARMRITVRHYNPGKEKFNTGVSPSVC
jgi:hypothetical protein